MIDAVTRPSWLILCDFDGTVTQVDVVDALLERFGLPGWRELEDQWTAGRIGSQECLSGQVALLDASAEAIDAFLDTVPVDPDFPAFLQAAAAQRHEVRIVSDGLDVAIRRILSRQGIEGLAFHSNVLRPAGANRWRLASPNAAVGCASGTCKCAIAQRHLAGRPCLMIGDGRSDFCVAAQADFVFAKGKLAAHCQRRGLSHTPVSGFEDVLACLPQLDELEIA